MERAADVARRPIDPQARSPTSPGPAHHNLYCHWRQLHQSGWLTAAAAVRPPINSMDFLLSDGLLWHLMVRWFIFLHGEMGARSGRRASVVLSPLLINNTLDGSWTQRGGRGGLWIVHRGTPHVNMRTPICVAGKYLLPWWPEIQIIRVTFSSTEMSWDKQPERTVSFRISWFVSLKNPEAAKQPQPWHSRLCVQPWRSPDVWGCPPSRKFCLIWQKLRIKKQKSKKLHQNGINHLKKSQ